MKMNDIMLRKGIEISEENDWNWMNHPAENGKPRWGRIRKEMRLRKDSEVATIGLEINTWERTIEVRFLFGTDPYVESLFWALLADRDVRRLIVEYQKSTRKVPYKIWKSCGVSGREDVFMTFGSEKGGFAVTNTIKLCHISCYGKLNEGFGDRNSRMYIGDFVELVRFLGLTEDMNVRSLRKRAGVKYIRPKFVEEISDFDTTVTKIL